MSATSALLIPRINQASRCEGPVSYAPDNGAIYNLHPGAHHKQFRNPDPRVMPDENITIDQLPRVMTEVDGIGR